MRIRSIRELQSMLHFCGFDLGPHGADGRWGPATELALFAWLEHVACRFSVPSVELISRPDLSEPPRMPPFPSTYPHDGERAIARAARQESPHVCFHVYDDNTGVCLRCNRRAP